MTCYLLEYCKIQKRTLTSKNDQKNKCKMDHVRHLLLRTLGFCSTLILAPINYDFHHIKMWKILIMNRACEIHSIGYVVIKQADEKM